MGHVLSYKRLRDESLHTFLGMVGYCMKDNGVEHFEFVHCAVSMEDMNVGKLEYAKFRKVGECIIQEGWRTQNLGRLV